MQIRDKSYLPCLACRVIIFMLNPNFRFQTRRLCSQWLNYQHTDNTESGNIRRSPHSDGNLSWVQEVDGKYFKCKLTSH